jgi:hypothetical protein
LQARIFDQASQHDGAHLVAETGEASELVEYALAPEKGVRGRREVVWPWPPEISCAPSG